jgi:hypothetical protein
VINVETKVLVIDYMLTTIARIEKLEKHHNEEVQKLFGAKEHYHPQNSAWGDWNIADLLEGRKALFWSMDPKVRFSPRRPTIFRTTLDAIKKFNITMVEGQVAFRGQDSPELHQVHRSLHREY